MQHIGKYMRRHIRSGLLVMASALAMSAGATARAELPSDLGSAATSVDLPFPASKHWVWVNDFVFPHMADGMAYLIDGDSGKYLGTLSTGYGFHHVLLPHDGKVIYSPETYFSRGTRGTRTDVVTVYDAKTLKVIREIAVPAKRSSNLPMIANNVLTDDDRFLLIYNFNPAQSITVVDIKTQKFVGEVETSGCALAFPTGPRSFFSVCGDGGLLLVQLDEKGAATQRRTPPIFSPASDPVTEKPVRIGKTWYFVSFAGRIHPVEVGAAEAVPGEPWWLTTEAERKLDWRPGGLQQLAVDIDRSRLYAIMHRGPLATHKEPGKDVWVYDLASRKRTQQFAFKNLASSILLTSDAKPLLFSLDGDSQILDVYDPTSGALLRSIDRIGTTPTVLVTP